MIDPAPCGPGLSAPCATPSDDGDLIQRVGGDWFALRADAPMILREAARGLLGARLERDGRVRLHRSHLPLLTPLRGAVGALASDRGADPEPSWTAASPAGRSPRDHQIVDAGWLGRCRGALHAGQTGVGKTLTAILATIGRGRRPLLVCGPLASLAVWHEELRLWDPALRVQALAGRRALGDRLPAGDPDVWLVHYDVLASWHAAFAGRRPEAVVLDECHRLRSPRSDRSQAAHAVVAGVPYRYGLTGTPIVRGPADLWSQLHAVVPGAFGQYWPFVRWATEVDETTWGMRPGDRVRGGVEGELEARLGEVVLRRTLAEVAGDLPPLTCDRRIVEPPSGYEGLRREVALALADCVGPAAALRQVGRLLALTGEAKLPHAIDLAGETVRGGAGPVIVWCWRRAAAARCASALTEEGLRAVALTGEGLEDLSAVVASYQAGGIDVVCATMAYAGESVTLTRCRTMIFAEIDWLPASMLQSIGRGRRLGSDHPLRVIFLEAAGTIDEEIVRRVRDRARAMDFATPGAAGPLREWIEEGRGGGELVENLVRAVREASRAPWWRLEAGRN